MNSEQLFDTVQAKLGGHAPLCAHVDSHRETSTPPSPSGELLMDYRPEGGIVIGGYEDGHWWNVDNGAKFEVRPYAWAALPNLDA